jgi:GNAT superfamily N-acetyltransferase
MIIKEIKDYNSFEFKQSINIYENSFPFNETRPFEDIVNMLRNDKNYHLIVSLNNNSVIGISLMYIFRSLNIGLLDYMAISPSYRGQGLGKEIFNFTFEKLCSIITNGIGLLIEIQKENNLLDHQEMTIRKNRIGFYNKLGVKLLDKVNYLLPQIYSNNKEEEEEEMYLLIKPIKKIYYLSKEQVIQYINIIYSTIYKYYDNDLLDKISSNIAEKIILRSLVL